MLLCLPGELVTDFLTCNNEKFNKYNYVLKIKLNKKFNELLYKHNSQYNSFFNIDRSKWIVNNSKKHIPDSVLNILSLGDKFGLPVNPVNKSDREYTVLETIKHFEFSSYKIPSEKIDAVRSIVTDWSHT